MNDFFTAEFLMTFSGLVIAVGLVVQFTKSIIKNKYGDASVRIYAFVVSLILTFIFANNGTTAQGIALTILNAILVTMTAMGGYELISDPKAEKQK